MSIDESNTINRLIDRALYYGLIAVACAWTVLAVRDALLGGV